MNRSGRYAIMLREFVTSEEKPSIRSLATKHGRSFSAVARTARLEKWEEKRTSHWNKVMADTSDRTVSKYAGRVIELHGKFLDSVEKTLDVYSAKLESGEITPTPTDVAKLMTTVREMVSKPSAAESPEGAAQNGITISESLGLEFIRAIEATARGRVERGGVVPPPRLVSGSSG